MRCFMGVVAAVLVLAAQVGAQERDAALRALYNASDCVCVVEVTEDPRFDGPDAEDVCTYTMVCRVPKIFHGGWALKPGGQKGRDDDVVSLVEATVRITRVERGATDKIPCLGRGGKCVLFLKATREDSGVKVDTTDRFLGVQPYSVSLVRRLAEMSREK